MRQDWSDIFIDILFDLAIIANDITDCSLFLTSDLGDVSEKDDEKDEIFNEESFSKINTEILRITGLIESLTALPVSKDTTGFESFLEIANSKINSVYNFSEEIKNSLKKTTLRTELYKVSMSYLNLVNHLCDKLRPLSLEKTIHLVTH